MLVKGPPVEVSDGWWMLGTNAYPLFLFRGQREGTLVEGSIGSMGPLVLEQMDQLGIDRDFVKQLIVTHAHPDHVMAVPLFRRMFPGVSVLASKAAASTLAIDKAIGFFQKIDGALNSALLKMGSIGEKHLPEPLEEQQIAVDRVVAEGDTIPLDGATLDGATLHVLETPGHSDCSLSFHEPDRRVLLVSDATGYYLPEHDAWWPIYFTGYEAYLQSIERLAELEAEVLCLGHNCVIKGAADVRSYLDRAADDARQYHQNIVEKSKAGKPARQIADELGAAIYERTQLLPVEFFQKNCGQMVKQSLAFEGISEGE